ncbi:MAG: hypothetical protein ACJ8MH_08890 [Povalibacter sp.]
MNTRNCFKVLALLCLLVGCAGQPTQKGNVSSKFRADPRGPDALLVEAMRRHTQQQDFAAALQLVKQAAEKAPDRKDIAWLYSQLCSEANGCQAESVETRLRHMDPTNAAVWLGPLARAQDRNDLAAENGILEAMSRGDHFDIYWNSLISKMAVVASAETAARLGPTVPDLVTISLNDVIGWVSAVAFPRFTPLSDTCSAERVANRSVAERCARIAAALTRGDTVIAESVGLGIAERLAPPNSQQAANVAEQIRRARYQRDTAGQIIAGQVEHDKFSRELIKLMAGLRREQDVFLAVIRWGGQPVQPTG